MGGGWVRHALLVSLTPDARCLIALGGMSCYSRRETTWEKEECHAQAYLKRAQNVLQLSQRGLGPTVSLTEYIISVLKTFPGRIAKHTTPKHSLAYEQPRMGSTFLCRENLVRARFTGKLRPYRCIFLRCG